MKKQPQFDPKALEAFIEDMKLKFNSIKKLLEICPEAEGEAQRTQGTTTN
jgi:hypothetical protein